MSTVDLHYETFGTAQPGTSPLVLVHGGAGTIGAHWGGVIPVLAKSRLVVGVELQGHGHTPHADRPYTFDNSADDIAALVRRLDLGPVDVAGFSNGGPVVLRLAQKYGDVVRRLVIASGFCRRDGMVPGFWDGFGDAEISSMPTELADAYRAIDPDPANLKRMFDLDVGLMRDFEDWDLDALAGIAQPALFVSGVRDVVLPAHTVDMAASVPRGWSLILPAGHGDYLGAAETGGTVGAVAKGFFGVLEQFLDADGL
ncbi:MAG: alpha/beta hydrolase [Nocardia sp.]|nr:alpha/beta hydrolase [Nocardia sp.]